MNKEVNTQKPMQLGHHSGLGTATRAGTTKPTNFPASIVAFSFLPRSEPEATMALSMSPVAKWQTQKFSANLGACGAKDKNQERVSTVGPGYEPGPGTYWLCELKPNAYFLVCNRNNSILPCILMKSNYRVIVRTL